MAVADPGLGPRLAGRAAIVTGAARGQGQAIARLFVQHGAGVVMGDILDDELHQAAQSIGPGAVAVPLDVTDETAWAGAVARCESEFGGVDVLVNNAGVVAVGTVAETPLDEYRRVVEVNQVGCFLGMKAVVPAMRRRGGGSIVNTSSVAGLQGGAGVIAYTASKWAVRGMTRAAAMELGGDGIRVNSIHPGIIDTPMINGPEFASVDRSAHVASLPAGRIGQAADVAWMALFLASTESSYCTGSEFIVDGGSTCGARR